MANRIYVTKPYLPPLEEMLDKVRAIYDRDILTNGGPEEREFEKRMKALLHSPHFFYVTNGTLALQLALRALDITGGEVITTPFTYVATTSAILWERCKPVFVDIDPATFNIDPQKIEAAITPETRAILPVHVFGHPCDVDAISAIAAKHELPVIYDAAHAFGVRKNGKPITMHGDITALSFHATKAFHTLEGGACVTANKAFARKLQWLKRFGHEGDNHFMLGINAKQDEINAAVGNLNLNHLPEIYAARRKAWEIYDSRLGKRYQTRSIDAGVDYNYAYFPVVFPDEGALKDAFKRCARAGIFPRRYFYPSLTRLPYIGESAPCPAADDISCRIACLPLSSSMNEEDALRICDCL